MSSLVHSGSKSLTARLLGRVKSKLEEFVAPQASFAYVTSLSISHRSEADTCRVNCLAALSKCSRLRYLDLSFVSESIAMSDLLRSTSVLSKLEVLHLPRSSTPNTSIESASYGWPSRLREIHVSGGIHDESAHCLTTLPPSVSHLSIGNCPHLSMVSIRPILSVKGPQLLYLEIVAPIPALTLSPKPLNNILGLLPNLRRLKISLDFISLACFDVQMVMTSILPLREIDLDCFDPAECELLTAEDVSYGISNTHTWGNLRKVRIHRRLGWTKTQCAKRSVGELDEYLKALAKEDGPGAEIKEHEAGVIFFGKK